MWGSTAPTTQGNVREDMIAYIPHEAAFMDKLNVISYKLLIYLGGQSTSRDVHLGTWKWETSEEIADALSRKSRRHYDAEAIEATLHQLCLCHCIECGTIAVLQHYEEAGEERVREVYRPCYRVVIALDE